MKTNQTNKKIIYFSNDQLDYQDSMNTFLGYRITNAVEAIKKSNLKITKFLSFYASIYNEDLQECNDCGEFAFEVEGNNNLDYWNFEIEADFKKIKESIEIYKEQSEKHFRSEFKIFENISDAENQ